MSGRKHGSLVYLQQEPVERFRIPNKTAPLLGAISTISFCAYPHISMLKKRQQAADALLAWMLRQSYGRGKPIKPPERLSRRALSPETVRRRVLKTAQRFELLGFDAVAIGQKLVARRCGAYRLVGHALAKIYNAKYIEIRTLKNFETETFTIREFLRERRSQSALLDEKGSTRDFIRRKWKNSEPALPILMAIHLDIMKFNRSKRAYDFKLPGIGRRCLTLCLLNNPDKWVPDIPRKSEMRRLVMKDLFQPDSFAELLPEFAAEDLINDL